MHHAAACMHAVTSAAVRQQSRPRWSGMYYGGQMVGGFARIANRVTRPLHSTFPAGSGARAHGLRAKAGAPLNGFSAP
jgi:hypothetical protein